MPSIKMTSSKFYFCSNNNKPIKFMHEIDRASIKTNTYIEHILDDWGAENSYDRTPKRTALENFLCNKQSNQKDLRPINLWSKSIFFGAMMLTKWKTAQNLFWL